jgi:hypothetical protein
VLVWGFLTEIKRPPVVYPGPPGSGSHRPQLTHSLGPFYCVLSDSKQLLATKLIPACLVTCGGMSPPDRSPPSTAPLLRPQLRKMGPFGATKNLSARGGITAADSARIYWD